MSCSQPFYCPDTLGCPPNTCPDFALKRHDTQPPFIVTVSDCDGPLDLTDCVVEVSMWAKAKFKSNVSAGDTSFSLADGIGFQQALVGDIIVVSRPREPEQMLIVGFDEINKVVHVQRGYHGSPIGQFKRGTALKIFRVLNSIGDVQTVNQEIENLDGTKETLHTESRLVYNWNASDTCLAGCYWLEFKLLKMSLSEINSQTEGTVASVGLCSLGHFVEWARRFPIDRDGFLIKIEESPTAENLN